MTQFGGTINCEGEVDAWAHGVTDNFTGGATVTINGVTKLVLPGEEVHWHFVMSPSTRSLDRSYYLTPSDGEGVHTGTITLKPVTECVVTTTAAPPSTTAEQPPTSVTVSLVPPIVGSRPPGRIIGIETTELTASPTLPHVGKDVSGPILGTGIGFIALGCVVVGIGRRLFRTVQ